MRSPAPRRRLGRLALLLALAAVAAGCLPALDGSTTGPLYDAGSGTFVDTNPGPCASTGSGLIELTTPGAVVDGLCVTDGTVLVRADNVTVRNSTLVGRPVTGSECDPQAEDCTSYSSPIAVLDGVTGTRIEYNVLDCGGDTTPYQNAASAGVAGHNVYVGHNEIRDCSDGVQLGSNSLVEHNLIHLPDNCDIAGVCDLHADGVQFSTHDPATDPSGLPLGIHDTTFRWNRVRFPAASSAFQFHNSRGQDPVSWPTRITVAYNWFEGGAYVVRFPGAAECPLSECNGVDLAFYGNRVNNADPSEFGLCDGDTDSVAVWGRETGSLVDSLPPGGPPDGVLDDDNIDQATGAILPRECDGRP